MRFQKKQLLCAIFAVCTVSVLNSQAYAYPVKYENPVCIAKNDANEQIEQSCFSGAVSAFGFDTNNDGVTDTSSGASEAFEIETTNGYVFGYLGRMTAPQAYFPNAARVLTDEASSILVGSGSYDNPADSSALSYRNVLYAQAGDGAYALEAFYATALTEFTGNLQGLLEAEELYRQALVVNPNFQDALDGLMEVYYARAEGFALIGNEYLANAYSVKYNQGVNASISIVDGELGHINNALVAYEQGLQEYFKLFASEYIGVGADRKDHLAINAEELLFTPRFTDDIGTYSIAERRGQSQGVGNKTRAFDEDGVTVGIVQGSPGIGASDLTEDVGLTDAPVKFLVPEITDSELDGQSGRRANVRFSADFEQDVKQLEILIEFDPLVFVRPANLSACSSSTDTDNCINIGGTFDAQSLEVFYPGEIFNSSQLFSNQMMIKLEAKSLATGDNIRVITLPLYVSDDQPDPFDQSKLSAYIAGSGGSLFSGFKDVALLYKLMSLHANATYEKVRRFTKDPELSQQALDVIDEEVQLIESWFLYVSGLLNTHAEASQLANNDNLQNVIARVAGSINKLRQLRSFIVSGANEFGYPDDYLPFYNNSSQASSFDAIAQIVAGGNFSTGSSSTWGGIFAEAREAELAALGVRDAFNNTKDRIRNELFVINKQVESRLAQVVGRINEDNEVGSGTDPIDINMQISHTNALSEIGQQVLLLDKAKLGLEQATESVRIELANIELEKQFLQDALEQYDNKTQVIAEFTNLQANLDIEISKVNAQQIRLQAAASAASSLVSGGITGGISGASAGVAAIQLASGMASAELEQKKGQLQAQKTRLSGEERVRLTQIDTEIFKLQQTKNIEQMINRVVVAQLTAQLAAIDVQLALGRLNKLLSERDELIAERNRAIANLGEMSFADPSFRLFEFNAMREASTQVARLKNWLYLMMKTFQYKWAIDDSIADNRNPIQTADNIALSLADISRVQVVGAAAESNPEVLMNDPEGVTATDIISALKEADSEAPLTLNLSEVVISSTASNNTARYSLREDFLRIVMNESLDTNPEELDRVRSEFQAWLNECVEKDTNGNCLRFANRNQNGDLVIEFDTMTHLPNYLDPVDDENDQWQSFALRSFSNSQPLWNHKITNVGVALKARGLTFTSSNDSVSATLKYGGSGFVKGSSTSDDDFNMYPMRQYTSNAGAYEPIEFRTVALQVPSSSEFESRGTNACGTSGNGHCSTQLSERPVAATRWRLEITASELDNIRMENLEDIFIYIDSQAYISQ